MKSPSGKNGPLTLFTFSPVFNNCTDCLLPAPEDPVLTAEPEPGAHPHPPPRPHGSSGRGTGRSDNWPEAPATHGDQEAARDLSQDRAETRVGPPRPTPPALLSGLKTKRRQVFTFLNSWREVQRRARFHDR